MNQITRHILTLLIGISLGNISNAQSLQELINTALVNNYQIRILKNETVMAENNNTWGNAGLLPTVSLNGGLSTSFNNTEQHFSNGDTQQGNSANTSNTNLSLMANWTAFDGFAVYALKDQFGYLEELGQLNSKYYIDQTVADIVTAYYQLVYEHLLLRYYQESMSISRYRLHLEEQRQLYGSGLKLDHGQALVAYQTDSILLMAQENMIGNLRIELNRILNNDLENPVSAGEDNSSFDFIPVLAKDSLFSQIEQNNQMIKIQLLNELISETQVRIEKANHYPKIDLYGGYQFTQSTAEVGFILLNRNLGPTVGLNVSFNLYNGGRTNIAVKNARLEQDNTALNREQVHINLKAEALTYYQQYTSILQRISLAESNVQTMEEVYQIAAEQLQEGEINGYDFRTVQLSLLNARIVLLQEQFTLKLVEINLNRISGNVLSVYL